jgi:hypothetical protein
MCIVYLYNSTPSFAPEFTCALGDDVQVVYPVTYFFLNKTVNRGPNVNRLFWGTVKRLAQLGFDVIGAVSDGAGSCMHGCRTTQAHARTNTCTL